MDSKEKVHVYSLDLMTYRASQAWFQKLEGITWWVNVCAGLAGCAPVYLSIFEITVYLESEYQEILDSDKTLHEFIVPYTKNITLSTGNLDKPKDLRINFKKIPNKQSDYQYSLTKQITTWFNIIEKSLKKIRIHCRNARLE